MIIEQGEESIGGGQSEGEEGKHEITWEVERTPLVTTMIITLVTTLSTIIVTSFSYHFS